MDKKTEKKGINCFVTGGFWAMIALLVLMMLFSFVGWLWPSLIAGILFVISIFFVFVVSIKALAPPEKSMAYIALGFAIVFILYVLTLIATASGSSVLG